MVVSVADVRQGPNNEFMIKELSLSYVTDVYDPSSFLIDRGITKTSKQNVKIIEMKRPLIRPKRAPIWLFHDLSFSLHTSLVNAFTIFQTTNVEIRTMITNATANEVFPLPGIKSDSVGA